MRQHAALRGCRLCRFVRYAGPSQSDPTDKECLLTFALRSRIALRQQPHRQRGLRAHVHVGRGLVPRASAQVPTIKSLNGYQKERVVANVGLTYLFTR